MRNIFKEMLKTQFLKRDISGLLILLLVLSAMPEVYGQDLPEFLPKTPEASALDKFIDIPPGSYTGVAGYSIPLYNIEVDGYSIPISLNYHGMGIKVNEVASSVGLGWNLSVGGISLSRQVVGGNDDDINRIDMETGFFNPDYPSVVPNPDFHTALNLHAGLYELQPDYYSYSLLHNLGKFIVDNIGNAQTIPKQDVKIIGNPPVVLIDNQGIEYRFAGQLESFSTTGNSSGLSLTESVIPSYHIEKIIFPSGKTIDFEYINSIHDYIANHSETKSVMVNNNNLIDPDWSDGACIPLNYNSSRTAYFMTEKLISKITYDNAEINFTYDTLEREDIGGKKLNNIKVHNLTGSTTKTIKDYNITTSYWQSPTPVDPNISSSSPLYDGLIKRLRLDGLEEVLSGKSYTFDYYNTHNLPYRLSKDTDFWGLYNGKNNTSYIHQYTYYDTNNEQRVSEGADKDPVLEYAQTAALKTVHLPTGGKQEFEYELDEYKFDATENLFYKREHTVPITSAMFSNGIADIPLTISGPDYRDGFDYKMEFYWADNALNGSNLQDLPIGSFCNVQLIDQNGNVVQTLYHNIEVELASLSQSNTYTFRFLRNDSSLPGSSSLWAKLTWYQNDVQYLANKNAGNLRVKSITLKDADNSIEIKRNYNYSDPNNPTFSSGEFREFPKSFITESPGTEPGGVGGTWHAFTCRYINYSNNYDVNTGTFKGKSVLYEHVKEEYVNISNSSENYYTQKQFSLPVIQGYPQPNNLPKTPFVDNSFTGGLLLNSQALNKNGEKISETINQYLFDNHFNDDSYNNNLGGVGSNAVSGGMLVSLISYGYDEGDVQTRFNWNYYFYPSTWVKLNETKTINYYGNDTVERTQTYAYNSNYDHIKPTAITTTNSLGEEVRTVYEYPRDLLAYPNSLDLINANRIANPLTTSYQEKASNGSWLILNKQETKYKDWGNSILEPEFVKTGKGHSTANPVLENRIVYHDYDDMGNPIEISKTDGTHIVYIWGYNKTLPIAKIENAAYAEVQSLVSNLETKSNEDDDRTIGNIGKEGALRLALNALRASLPNAMITTYTYDPLIGVTSITDPKGYISYYEYDEASRLKRVKDAQGNILGENTYHYKNQ